MIVAIPVFQRHDYLERCLKSLRACPEFSDSAILMIVPDAGESIGALEALALRCGFGDARVEPLPTTRLWCDANTIRARDIAFTCQHDLVLTMDSDLCVTPAFLTTLVRCESWLTGKGLPCIVQSNVTCPATHRHKNALVGAVSTGFNNGNMHLMRREVYQRITPMLHEFRDRFCHIPPRERDTEEIRAWLAGKASAPDDWGNDRLLPYREHDCGVAHDAVTFVAMLREGVLPAHLAINYAINIGEVGENMTPEVYHALRHVKLNSLPAPDTFRWWPTPHPITCVGTL
jgi:hypothetical protein